MRPHVAMTLAIAVLALCNYVGRPARQPALLPISSASASASSPLPPRPPRPPPPPPPSAAAKADDDVHVVLAADPAHLPGVAGVIASARTHFVADGAASLRFHVVTLREHVDATHAALGCFLGGGAAAAVNGSVEVAVLPVEWLAGRVRVVADPAVTGPLASPLNFARFYLPALLPSLRRALYLDADVVVRGNLMELWRRGVESARALGVPAAAVPRPEAHFRYSRYEAKCGPVFAARYPGRRLNRSAPTFNAGVMLLDLASWASRGLTAEAEWWMAQHAAAADGLWALGSQPIMHMILYGRWAPLPTDWNLDGLGRVPNLPPSRLRQARLLHWTGKHKPWLRHGLYARHFPREVASRTARCAARDGPYYRDGLALPRR